MSTTAQDTRWLDATAQAELVRHGEASAIELLEAAIARVEEDDPALNTVVLRWFDEARATAASSTVGPTFAGVPFLIKDLTTEYAGQLLCRGNRALKRAAIPSTADSTTMTRFRAAGLVTMGRTNAPEFGSLATTTGAAWGPARNPWDASRTPGGSSGGSAAAVASGMVPIAHATDGGGSIRIPAASCGLVGLKPSHGRVSAGPHGDETDFGVELCVSRTVRDTAAMLDAIAGPGIGDALVAPPPARPYLRELTAAPVALRIGMLDHLPSGDSVHEHCAEATRRAAALLEQLGHIVEPSFPAALADPDHRRRIAPLRGIGLCAEMDALARALGRPLTPEDVEPFNWERAERSRRLTAVDHHEALAARVHFRRAVHRWWADGFDLLLTPTLPEPPPTVDSFTDPAEMLHRAGRTAAFTHPFNDSGQPAISVPLHQTPEGLPVGIQLVAAWGRDDLLLRTAAQLEQAAPWAERRPGAPRPEGS